MATEKRERQRALREQRLAQEVTIERRRSVTKRTVRLVVVGIAVAVFIFVVSVRGDDTGDEVTSDDPVVDTTDQPVDDTPRDFAYGTGECPPEGGPDAPVVTFTDAPQQCITPDEVDYRATVTTSMGEIVIDLFDDRAPGTVNNFVTLARYRFFEGLTFHRVAAGFVNQGGDPNGDGSGGPGYRIPDELPASLAAYVEGAVAMANSGPDTSGSQWFMLLENRLGAPAYSLFGLVTDDTLDVAREINGVETEAERPLEDVTIESVEITELDDGAIDDDAIWDLGT